MGLEGFVEVKVKRPVLVVDKREEELARDLEGLGAKVKRQLLPYGDVLIPPLWRVEVKRGRDLLASLYDGRLFPQISGGEKVLLVLEGLQVEEPAVLFGLLASLLSRGIPVVQTRSGRETAQLLYRLAHHTQIKEGQSPKLVRVKRAYAREEGLKAMLMVIPGVGPKKAQSLLERYPSMEELVKAPKRALQGIVGRKVGERVWEYLHRPLQSTKALPDKKA